MLMMIGMTGIVSATSITYTDVYEADHQYMRGSLWGADDSVSWTFDITDDGFDAATQDVISADMVLNFQDDRGRRRKFDFFWEFARLEVGTNSFRWEVDSGDRSFALSSLVTLSDTGRVDVTLTALLGDFYFNSATLTAEAIAPIPEPATLLLMGIGLVGIAGFRRRKRS